MTLTIEGLTEPEIGVLRVDPDVREGLQLEPHHRSLAEAEADKAAGEPFTTVTRATTNDAGLGDGMVVVGVGPAPPVSEVTATSVEVTPGMGEKRAVTVAAVNRHRALFGLGAAALAGTSLARRGAAPAATFPKDVAPEDPQWTPEALELMQKATLARAERNALERFTAGDIERIAAAEEKRRRRAAKLRGITP